MTPDPKFLAFSPMQRWSRKHSFTQSRRFFLCCRLHAVANTFWNQSPNRRTLLHLRVWYPSCAAAIIPLQILFGIILQFEGHPCTPVAVVFILLQFDISHPSFLHIVCCIPDTNHGLKKKHYSIKAFFFFYLFFWHHCLLAMQPTATFLLDRKKRQSTSKKKKKIKKSIKIATSTPHV